MYLYSFTTGYVLCGQGFEKRFLLRGGYKRWKIKRSVRFAKDFLLFRNVDPISAKDLAAMREVGAICIMNTDGNTEATVEIVGSKCSEEKCALWHEDAQECSLLSLAKAVRRISRNGR